MMKSCYFGKLGKSLNRLIFLPFLRRDVPSCCIMPMSRKGSQFMKCLKLYASIVSSGLQLHLLILSSQPQGAIASLFHNWSFFEENLGYGKAFATSLKRSSTLLPSALTETTITKNIKAAIIAYSIDVTPSSFCRNLMKLFRIGERILINVLSSI